MKKRPNSAGVRSLLAFTKFHRDVDLRSGALVSNFVESSQATVTFELVHDAAMLAHCSALKSLPFTFRKVKIDALVEAAIRPCDHVSQDKTIPPEVIEKLEATHQRRGDDEERERQENDHD